MALRNCSPHNIGLDLRLGVVSSSSSCGAGSVGAKQRRRAAVKRRVWELQVSSFSERCLAWRGSWGGRRLHRQPAGNGESAVLGSLGQGRNGASGFLSARRQTVRRAASRPQYNVPQQPETVPVWLWICAALYRTVGDAMQFLWEQPGQLKDIEWPSLHSTIRMAALTVVVVALLIIFLATIDSTFSFVLSSLLRRVA